MHNNAYWLYDYIAYTLLKEINEDKPWYDWPDKYRFADVREFLDSMNDEQKKKARTLAEEQY